MKTQRVTLITLGVADLAAARAFYTRLGWVEQSGTDTVAFFQMQGQALGLFGRADLAVDQGRAGASLGTGAMTLAQNFPDRAGVDAAYAQALAAGATGLKPPEPVFWGGYSGYWADPDGHVWEVAHNPFWPLSPDGSLTLPGGVEKVSEQSLTNTDDRAIAALLARCFTTDFGGRSYFQTRHHLRLMIRGEAGVLAHMALQWRAVRLGGRLLTVAGLADVATDPSVRGQGLAGRLLQAAIDEARASPAEFLLLFGTAGLYAGAGFRRAANPMTWVEMRGARTGDVCNEPAESLMVLPLRDAVWDAAAPLDLLGNLF